MSLSCYCGKLQSFQQCCQPLHLGQKSATTPEELMRSRYSAFCCKNVAYLIHTHLPEKRTQNDEQEIQQTMNTLEWHRLQVLEARTSRDRGTVEFVAFFSTRGEPGQIHEKSQFQMQDNQWFYVDGEQLSPVKLQRNDLCWCGSDKKYKKCCNTG